MTNSQPSRRPGDDFIYLPPEVQPRMLARLTRDEIGAWIETAPVGILVADDRLRITGLNQLARPLFQMVPDVVGKFWPEVLRLHWTEDAANEVITVITKTLATGVPYSSIDFSADRIDLAREQRFHWEVHRIVTRDAQALLVCYFVGPVA